jgi:hypothetical protein
MDLLPESEWPLTVDEAVRKLLTVLTAEQQERVRQTAAERVLVEFHENMGRWIRNQFGLWGRNKKLFEATGAGHPDEASMVIIQALWKHLRESAPPVPNQESTEHGWC